MQENLELLLKEAGGKIMEIYNSPDFEKGISYKDDRSPLTIADTASNDILEKGLKEILDIPILSEESREVPFEERKSWDAFWLVDPLDGTKEFIKRNGEFTINVALIENGRPKIGMISAPYFDIYYFGGIGLGSWKKENGVWLEIKTKGSGKKENLVSVGSRSHSSDEEKEILKGWGVEETMARGSAFKFGMVAEGKADLYYRHGPTMEWDTGAGQAVVEGAGGKVFKGYITDEEFTYNKQNLRNGSFICLGLSPEAY